jgi:hypothetical protein
MKEHRTRAQESARQAAPDSTHEAAQLAGTGIEALTAWSDAARHALRDVAGLSARTRQEGARQLSEWQQANLELVREMQTVALRWFTIWPEFWCAPLHGYQRALEESIDTGHRVIELTRRNAETLAQSCQRLERAADDTTRTVGEAFREASTRRQTASAKSDRARAA